MKKILFIFLILLSFCSCKKDKTEYVIHDFQIFNNDDTLIIGRWDYLYTWNEGGYTGASYKRFENRPTLDITPKGYYEMIRDNMTVSSGVIDTVGNINKYLLVMFYPNGVKSQNVMSQTLYTLNRDTLIIGLGGSGDYSSDAYYKRVKD
jgi:hypothetical protein